MFTHLKRDELEVRLHISHLFHYVSAYEYNEENLDWLVSSLESALEKSKSTMKSELVDLDGEFCFRVTPAGYITLMIPWKTYVIDKNTNEFIVYAIGFREKGKWNFVDGPNPVINNMLDTEGKKGYYILKLVEGRTLKLYKWIKNKWVKNKKVS